MAEQISAVHPPGGMMCIIMCIIWPLKVCFNVINLALAPQPESHRCHLQRAIGRGNRGASSSCFRLTALLRRRPSTRIRALLERNSAWGEVDVQAGHAWTGDTAGIGSMRQGSHHTNEQGTAVPLRILSMLF